MFEASVDAKTRLVNRKWAVRSKDRWSATSLFECGTWGRTVSVSGCAMLRCAGVGFHTGYSRVLTRIKGTGWNQGTHAILPGSIGMIQATDDRIAWGRSLRSSPRAGKPSTGRRETVDTVCRQEV